MAGLTVCFITRRSGRYTYWAPRRYGCRPTRARPLGPEDEVRMNLKRKSTLAASMFALGAVKVALPLD
jgi:hypothetical protein